MINERPNSVLVWSNSLDTSNCIEPSLGQKVTGWSIDDEPPAEWMNWFQNTVASFVLYLDEMSTMWASNYQRRDVFASANSAFDILDIAHGPYGVYEQDTFILVGDSNELISVSPFDPEKSGGWAFDIGISTIYAIEYGDGYWFLSTPNTQYYSDDYLSSFTESDTITPTVRKIKYDNGYWVCATLQNIYYRASDPTGAFTDPWLSGGRDIYDIDYSEEDLLWIGVGEFWGSASNVWYKDHPPNDEFTGIAAGSNTLYCVTHGVVDGNTVWLAGGENNELYKSVNPKVSWEQLVSPFDPSCTIRTARFGNGVFLIGAQTQRGGAFISRDLINWSRVAEDNYYFASDYYDHRFILSGDVSYLGNTITSLRHGNLGNSL